MIKVFSPAKINLTLDVKSKAHGASFHEIETIYHLLDWGDQMQLEPSDKFVLEGDFECDLKDNLIYQAWKAIPHARPVKVTVEKVIPPRSGLGGGSSNAAAFLKGYEALTKTEVINETMMGKMADLGKDIPFFLSGHKCALGTGFGEIITPLDYKLSGTPIYIYLGGTKQSTAAQYAQLKQFDTTYTRQFDPQDLTTGGNTFNQFIEQKICSTNLCGSGPSCFHFEDLDREGYTKIKTILA